MTNPTADAAKLLPCHDNEWHPVGDGTPLNTWLETKREGEDGTNVCLCRVLTIGDEPEWCEQPPYGRTTVTHHTFAAPTHWRWNTRPQPAPPAGEPDLTEAWDKLQAPTQRVGLAARPKVEDAEIKHATKMLRDDVAAYHEIADLLERFSADLRTKETQLAQAYDVIAHTLTPTDCFTGDIAVVTAAHASHQSRQQAAKDVDDHRSSKAGETR